jgi:hypothetical protein
MRETQLRNVLGGSRKRLRKKRGSTLKSGAFKKVWQTDEGGGNAICRVDISLGRRMKLLSGVGQHRSQGGGEGVRHCDNDNMHC